MPCRSSNNGHAVRHDAIDRNRARRPPPPAIRRHPTVPTSPKVTHENSGHRPRGHQPRHPLNEISHGNPAARRSSIPLPDSTHGGRHPAPARAHRAGPPVRSNSRPVLRTRRSAQPPLFRSSADPGRNCHLRWVVPRAERRHPLVVRGDHSCQNLPAIIEEVRRILHEHLKRVDSEAPR
jgi:hypothetical protein